METIATIILGSLATFRLTLLINEEEGPFYLFVHLREWSAKRTFTGALISCFWCLSVWMAAPVALILSWGFHLPWWMALLIWLASSAGAIMTKVFLDAAVILDDYLAALMGRTEE